MKKLSDFKYYYATPGSDVYELTPEEVALLEAHKPISSLLGGGSQNLWKNTGVLTKTARFYQLFGAVVRVICFV